MQTQIPELRDYCKSWPLAIIWDIKQRDYRPRGRKDLLKLQQMSLVSNEISLAKKTPGGVAVRYIGKPPPSVVLAQKLRVRLSYPAFIRCRLIETQSRKDTHVSAAQTVPMDTEPAVSHRSLSSEATFQKGTEPLRLTSALPAPIFPPESAMEHVFSPSPTSSVQPAYSATTATQQSSPPQSTIVKVGRAPVQQERCPTCGSAPQAREKDQPRLRSIFQDDAHNDHLLRILEEYGIYHDFHLALLEKLDDDVQDAVLEDIETNHSRRLALYLRKYLHQQRPEVQFTSTPTYHARDIDEVGNRLLDSTITHSLFQSVSILVS